MPSVVRPRKKATSTRERRLQTATRRSPVPAPRTDGDRLVFGGAPPRFSISFQRTLRIPDEGKTYPLPPGLGKFPIRVIDPKNTRIPVAMRARGGFLIPMYQREALWICFHGRTNAVQVGVGEVNAVSGRQWRQRLTARPQNYIVAPDQPWLDGINAGTGFIRQFVAMPLGKGYTVEEQVTGKAKHGGMQIRVVPAKPGVVVGRYQRFLTTLMCADATSMGFGAGGKMKQTIDSDEYGIDTWDLTRMSEAFVHIVNGQQWTAITGEPLPPTPIDAGTYTQFGFPWFDLYRDDTPAVGPSEVLGGVKTVGGIDKKKGFPPQQGDDTVPIPNGQVVTIGDKGWPKG